MKYKRYIDSLSDDIKKRMMEYQVEQGNKADLTVFYEKIMASALNGGFCWEKTDEDYDYWYDILDFYFANKWLDENKDQVSPEINNGNIMTKLEQEQILNNFTAKMKEILLSKGDDYAGEDRLHTFKVVSMITGLDVKIIDLVFIATKVVRLGSLLRNGGTPNHESIADNAIDLANYAAFLDMLISDSQQPAVKEAKMWDGTPVTGKHSEIFDSKDGL